MHKIYIALSYLLIPLIIINTQFRVLRNKEDKKRYKERYGKTSIKKPFNKEVIWIHASSVGEFKSTDFLINHFFEKYCVLITTTTTSASEYAIKNYGDKIIHQYAPFDVLSWINNFLNNWKPKLVIWIESDLWPNTIVSLRKKKIKSIFLNARISPKSYKRWGYFPSYYDFITQSFSAIFAQSENDLERLRSLSKNNIKYLGNLKLTKKKKVFFDYEQSENLIIMIASTHDKEENLIIPMLEIISKKDPTIEFIIVPRHPIRSKAVCELLKTKGLRAECESLKKNVKNQFLIIDSFGRMNEYFNRSDIVLLGGSLTKNGGHNPIEAAIANCAIITGSYVFNWQNLYEDMCKKQACMMIKDPKELEIIISKLINDKNIIRDYKKKALSFSKTVFFEEKKLLKLLNEKLK